MVKSVEKAVRILNAFNNGQPSMNLSEVAAVTGLDKSGAQRFTHTLVQLGLLRKDPDTKRFELTPRVLEFGANYTRSSTLVRAAVPYLLNLSQTTEESVSLTVLDDVDVVYVQRLLSRNMLTTDVRTGTRLPAYCTAPGIAILSGLPRAEALAILNRSDRKPITPKTHWEIETILEEIDRAIAQGYAFAVDQIYLNDISVAAPIYGTDGRAIAAVSIGVSRLRCSVEDACARFAPLLVSVAETLSHGRPQRHDHGEIRKSGNR
jgi:DNA-binding IclR family transcriptional regulator